MKPDFLFLCKWKSHLKPFLPKWQQPAIREVTAPLPFSSNRHLDLSTKASLLTECKHALLVLLLQVTHLAS